MRSKVATVVGSLAAGATVVGAAGVAGASGFDGDSVWSDEHTISQGWNGNNVGLAQQVMSICENTPGLENVDGVFGAGTKNSVIWYQALHSLSQDGVVGLLTWHSLRGEIAHKYTSGTNSYYRPHHTNCAYMAPPNDLWWKSSETWKWRAYAVRNSAGDCDGWVNTNHPETISNNC